MDKNELAIKTLVDRYCKIAAEKEELERRIKELQAQLSPPKSIVKFENRVLYLN